MNESPGLKHLLIELGVLKIFNVGKRIDPEKIKKFSKRSKKLAKTKAEAEELLSKAIIKEAQKEISIDDIPGAVANQVSEKKLDTEKRLVNLTHIASLIAKTLTDKNTNKFDRCYLINILVNMLGLGEEDFEDFHKKIEKLKSGEIESPEDDTGEPEPL